MNRKEFNNEKFRLVVGADNFTGSFMQVLAQPAEEQDCPLLWIDNHGVHAYFVIPEVENLVKETEERFKKSHIKFPNIDAETICRFAEKLGFNIQRKEIYAILD